MFPFVNMCTVRTFFPKFSIEPDSGSEPRRRSDFVHRREVAFRVRWRRQQPRLQAYVHSNRLNRRIFLDVPLLATPNLVVP